MATPTSLPSEALQGAGQWAPTHLAGLPEDDRDRLALLDRLLAERFPGMRRRPPTLATTGHRTG